ncbi:MAG: xylulokinase [Anaerolineae bacterium]|nr:xylulokinase [Anaerolineae bacterium]MCX8068263.1 xylulokinase [Anaerolineae bacterium]MDW7992765.1 xylulokinase [Anaerolineae bacterium]MDW8069150.1 xylulokinase [Anaerolineae bacterium]
MVFFMGIDVSTTATKALLISADGAVVGVASSEYAYETPRPMWTEQHPHLWWAATVDSIRRVLAESGVKPADIKGIGLTGQMHGLVLLDEKGEVLRPAILWNDQRTAAECDEIRARLGKERLIQITGNDALTGFTAPKILWVRNHEPEVFRRARHILLPKDYVRYRLTGEYAIDKADGAGTILFDLRKRDWSSEVLDALEINPEWLPPTFEGPQITGGVTSEAAEETGLKAGTPVVAGGGDQSAQAVGVGAVEPGVVALTLGTSGVVFASTQEPFIEPQGRLHAFCHAVPGRWHLMGVMLSAGGSLRWYRDTVAPGTDFDALLKPAGEVPPGCEGLLFLPYLTGERTPHPDPLARGAFVGLTVRHTLAYMTRAVLEGVAFGLRDSFELMKESGLKEITQVRASGGGARSSLWRQILADVLGVELVTVNTTEGAAYGAALLAAVGAGAFPDVPSACSAVIRITGRTVPGPATSFYEDMYPLYRALYPALCSTFQGVARLIA